MNKIMNIIVIILIMMSTSVYAKDLMQTKGNCAAGITQLAMLQGLEALIDGDDEAVNKLFDENKVFILKAGMVVYVGKPYRNVVSIRVKGTSNKAYTTMNCLLPLGIPDDKPVAKKNNL